MTDHRGHGRGRYLAPRPRHRRRRPGLILAVCATLSLVSLALIGARFVQVRGNHPVARFEQNTGRAIATPKAYTPRRATPDVAPLRRKKRPPVVLGVLDQAGLTRYCVATTGPLTTAELQGGTWRCKPFLGAAQPADLTAACRLIHADPKAEAKPAGPGSWRCVTEAA